MYGLMYRRPVIIGKISPDKPLRPEGAYKKNKQNEKITSHGASFYNVFVSSIHSVDQQRNNPPKTLTLLSNRRHWG